MRSMNFASDHYGERLMRLLITLFLAASLIGCAVPFTNPQEPARRMAFPETEYLALPKTGNATIRGQAFLTTKGGDVKVAAGKRVLLNPVTSYSLEWYERSYVPSRRMEEADPKLDAYIRTQIADSGGRFAFKNVPAGEYFITTTITWEVTTGYQGGGQVEGGMIAKRVKVNAGEEIEAIVTW
jgi:hypothetical protein